MAALLVGSFESFFFLRRIDLLTFVFLVNSGYCLSLGVLQVADLLMQPGLVAVCRWLLMASPGRNARHGATMLVLKGGLRLNHKSRLLEQGGDPVFLPTGKSVALAPENPCIYDSLVTIITSIHENHARSGAFAHRHCR